MRKKLPEIQVVDLTNVGPPLDGMVNGYPKPLKFGWNCVKQFKPPSGKLQFYTIGGVCIYGEYSNIADGFVTHWAYLLPSPSKQMGKIK